MSTSTCCSASPNRSPPRSSPPASAPVCSAAGAGRWSDVATPLPRSTGGTCAAPSSATATWPTTSRRWPMRSPPGIARRPSPAAGAPLQLLGEAVDTYEAGAMARWWEWEEAGDGRRQLTWSTGRRDLRALAQLGAEATDEDIAKEDLDGEARLSTTGRGLGLHPSCPRGARAAGRSRRRRTRTQVRGWLTAGGLGVTDPRTEKTEEDHPTGHAPGQGRVPRSDEFVDSVGASPGARPGLRSLGVPRSVGAPGTPAESTPSSPPQGDHHSGLPRNLNDAVARRPGP